MRRLLLFRHSKAERSEAGGADRTRALTERGRADAALIGGYLARHALQPDRVLISPALRARETWTIAAQAFHPAPPATDDARIYDASPQALLAVIKAAGADARALMLVGHNPGLHELAMQLIAAGDIETRERLGEKFPTSGLAVIDFAFDDWGRLHDRAGRLERFVSPRSIGASIN